MLEKEWYICFMRHLGVPPGDVVGMFPQGLEGNGLLIPVVDGGGDGIHGHDVAH